MKHRITFILLFIVSVVLHGHAQNSQNEILINESWKFFHGDINGAEKLSFNDKYWRDIDLSHDWSIEKLPGQEPGQVVGHFSKDSLE
jgi:beta-galactosidase